MLGESGAGNWGRTGGSWGRSGRCSGVRTLVEGRGNRGVHRGRRKGRGISGWETAESGTGELNGNCIVGRRGGNRRRRKVAQARGSSQVEGAGEDRGGGGVLPETGMDVPGRGMQRGK